ncbi:MAG TPA: SGNH/GDSL hydrolase family protein [Stellaceae bacterium]|jgi:lysophospholipase L1-like esterase
MKPVAALAAAAVSFLFALPASAFTLDDRCTVPGNLAQAGQVLPHVSAAIANRAPLKIVALGSSSTAGTGASSVRATYPYMLKVDLGERLGRAVEVANKGIGGESARQMIARIDRDVAAEHPALVIWQTGTNDFLQDVPVATFAAQLHDGIARLRATGADVVLMEPQYMRRPVHDGSYRRYVVTMRTVAAAEHVPVLRRYDIMAYWLDTKHFDMATMLSHDGLHMVDASYGCISEVAADLIENGLDPKVRQVVAHHAVAIDQTTSR